MTGAPTRVYPLTAPGDDEDDPRFNAGLIYDVARVLAAHGYPRPVNSPDLVELQLALAGFLYAAPAAETRSDGPEMAAEPRTQATRYEDTGPMGGTK